jgi:hypothetical protein
VKHETGDAAEFFQLEPGDARPFLRLMRPCAPFQDPRDIGEIGRIRWAASRPVFVSNDYVELTRDDVRCIEKALRACEDRKTFEKMLAGK